MNKTALKERVDSETPSISRWTVISDVGPTYYVRMSTSDWIALPDHERQRDTERHARKPHWKFVREATGPAREALRMVVAGELDGLVCKVDGHARALLWREGGLPDPGEVFATVYRCETRAQLNHLYSTFDTQTAAESIYDRITGAYRQHKLYLKSPRLRDGMIGDALSIAMTGKARSKDRELELNFDVYEAVGMFREELLLLDRINPPQNIFQNGLIAAGLLSISRSPSSLIFFSHLALTRGKRRGMEMDPVAGVLEYIKALKANRSAWVKVAQEDLCARTLGAAELYEKGERAVDYWSIDPPPPVALESVVAEVQQSKRG